MAYIVGDKKIRWDESKNLWLRRTRGLTFEEIVLRLAGEDLLDIMDHPHIHRYPGQRLFVVRVENLVVFVPFVEDKETIFLKTIIPSRRLKKIYEERKDREA